MFIIHASEVGSALKIHRFRSEIEIGLVKIEVGMQPWSSRFALSNHDRKLENQFPSKCFRPLLVVFVEMLIVYHPFGDQAASSFQS